MSTAADADVPARIILRTGRPASGLPGCFDLMSAPDLRQDLGGLSLADRRSL